MIQETHSFSGNNAVHFICRLYSSRPNPFLALMLCISTVPAPSPAALLFLLLPSRERLTSPSSASSPSWLTTASLPVVSTPPLAPASRPLLSSPDPIASKTALPSP